MRLERRNFERFSPVTTPIFHESRDTAVQACNKAKMAGTCQHTFLLLHVLSVPGRLQEYDWLIDLDLECNKTGNSHTVTVITLRPKGAVCAKTMTNANHETTANQHTHRTRTLN